MSISRRIARPLLASIFIAGGLDAIRHPQGKIKAAEAVTEPLSEQLPALPQDTGTLVRLNGAVQVGGGALLAIGKFRRLAALALIGSLIPTTLAGHRFWEEADEAKRAQQQIHFLKNLGLLGGLILAAVDAEGAPSLGWKARRRARRMATALTVGHAMADVHAHRSISKASGVSRKAGRRANRAAHKIPHRANDAATDAARHANVATSQALTTGTAIAAPFVRHANETVLSTAKTAAEVAGPFISAGVERAGDLFQLRAPDPPV